MSVNGINTYRPCTPGWRITSRSRTRLFSSWNASCPSDRSCRSCGRTTSTSCSWTRTRTFRRETKSIQDSSNRRLPCAWNALPTTRWRNLSRPGRNGRTAVHRWMFASGESWTFSGRHSIIDVNLGQGSKEILSEGNLECPQPVAQADVRLMHILFVFSWSWHRGDGNRLVGRALCSHLRTKIINLQSWLYCKHSSQVPWKKIQDFQRVEFQRVWPTDQRSDWVCRLRRHRKTRQQRARSESLSSHLE